MDTFLQTLPRTLPEWNIFMDSVIRCIRTQKIFVTLVTRFIKKKVYGNVKAVAVQAGFQDEIRESNVARSLEPTEVQPPPDDTSPTFTTPNEETVSRTFSEDLYVRPKQSRSRSIQCLYRVKVSHHRDGLPACIAVQY